VDRAAVRRYRRYLALQRAVARVLPVSAAFYAGARLAGWLSPRRAEAAVAARTAAAIQGLDAVRQSVLFRRYIGNVGVSDITNFLLPRLGPVWADRQVAVQGRELVQRALAAGRGVMLMTYHHHHNGLFCATTGMLGFPTWVVARDPKISPLYAQFPVEARHLYRETERHFSGGRYLYVAEGRSNTRAMLAALKGGSLLVTANDFTAPAGARQLQFAVCGRTVSLPVGSLQLALSLGCPVLAGYLLWQGRGRFQIHYRALDGGGQIAGVMAQYLGWLEELAASAPAVWEGWKRRDWYPQPVD
jgi:lauroyl/myristoyl acyltransferase